MSAKDKSGLGYGDQTHEGVLSYENEVLESVFDNRSSDVEDTPVYDRFSKVEGMHGVPPLMTGIYMPPKFDFGIDKSKFTYGSKQSKTSESDAKTSDFTSCESNSSVETLESVPKPTVNEPKAVSKPKETVKEQNTCSPSPKADKKDWNGLMSKKLGLGYRFTRKACFVCDIFGYLIRDCDFHEKRMAKQIELNKRMVRGYWPQQVVIGDPKYITGTKSSNTIVDQTLDDPQKALKNKGIIDSGCSRHMTGNKAYLVEYQDYNGGPVAFGGSKGQITGKDLLLRVPRQNNMYSFNLENIVPTGGLACLIAKATVDESNKWHRRLEFKNRDIIEFCRSKGIKREYSNARTPQQNGVAERKNRTLIEAARTMLADSFLITLCGLKKLKPFRKEFAQSTKDLLLQAGAVRATSTNTVNTVSSPVSTASPSRVFSAGGPSYPDLTNNDQDDSQIPALWISMTISKSKDEQNVQRARYFIEPKKISQALEDESWVDAMQEELLQFKIQKVWILVDLPFWKKAIGTKWEEGINYDEVFAPVARMKPSGSFWPLLLIWDSYFVDSKFPKKVYKVVKALYGLHQAPKAWYATLSTFLLKSGNRRGTIDKTLFIKKYKNDIMSSRKKMTASTPIETLKPLIKDEEAADVDSVLVLGFSDYAGANLDRKSTTGGCQFLGRRLISWQCKKQTIVATSTTEAEYVAAANCCGQVLWIQNQFIDNESTICIVKNPVFHSKTKHIEIRHHFIRDAYEKKLIQVLKIHTDDNVADLLTKAFDVSRFNFLIVNIGMLNL
ncbi:putative ribonuclease H-like domain-containing protein [Tanacetum coccineum]